MKKIMTLVCALFLCVGSVNASTTIINTFGSGDSYSDTSGVTVGWTFDTQSGYQFSFTGSDYSLTSVEFAVTTFINLPHGDPFINDLYVRIWSETYTSGSGATMRINQEKLLKNSILLTKW